jgi:hypothetical protein
MKYKCIKDIGRTGCLEVGKIYDVESEDRFGLTRYIVNKGKTKLHLSKETISMYLEKVED